MLGIGIAPSGGLPVVSENLFFCYVLTDGPRHWTFSIQFSVPKVVRLRGPLNIQYSSCFE